MARIGQNPERGQSAAMKIENIVLGCVTHLPNFEGYHAKRFEVVKLCLNSMRNNAKVNATAVIWDNGSCEDFRNWLEKEYKPDILIKSDNVGKSVARAGIFGLLNPETIVNYSDDDIYYYPDWFKPQLDILNTFPNVSCVTGYPTRASFQLSNKNTITRLKPSLYGKFIPQKWEDDYAISIGLSKEKHKAMTDSVNDIIVEYKGMKAFATSHHCQQIGKAGLLTIAARKVIMYNAMPTEVPYDEALDALGNRLATTTRYTRHMGNVIDKELEKDILAEKKK